MPAAAFTGVLTPAATLIDTFRTVEPHLAEPLVSARALEAVRAFGARIPAALTDYVYLECRLAAGEQRVDAIIRVAREAAGSLSAGMPGCSPDAAPRRGAGWDRVEAVARAWMDERGVLARGVQQLWLEFDLWLATAGEPAPVLSPGVFADLHRDAYTRWSIEEQLSLATDVLELLRGAPIVPSTRDCLRRCLEALPAGGSDGAGLLYLGALPDRGDVVRACVIGLDDDALPGYLHAVGWPGCPDALARTLAPAARAKGSAPAAAILHLDIGKTVQPRFGLEYVLARRPQPGGTLHEQALLDHLVSIGLCTRDKREALERWPGWSIATLPHELWESLVARRVNHIKVLYEGGVPVEAKAYLSFNHRFWSRRRHRAALAPSAEAAQWTRASTE